MPKKNKIKRFNPRRFKRVDIHRLIFILAFANLAAYLLVLTYAATPGYDLAFENDQITRINAHRRSRGLNALISSGCMRDVARNHAKRMADRGEIYHNTSQNVETVAACDGQGWTWAGENVGRAVESQALFQGFLNSPTHRSVIEENATHMAVGVYRAADGNAYVVHNLVRCEECNSKYFQPPANPVNFKLSKSNSNPATNYDFNFGVSSDIILVCDWDGNGMDTPGVFRPSNATWYLRSSNSTVSPHATFRYGSTTDKYPVCGDWNGDGKDTVGLFRPGNATWYLRNTNSAGNADITFRHGSTTDRNPIVGDWNGDGKDTIGFFRSGQWLLRNNNSGGLTNIQFTYVPATGKPVVGDWNNDGKDTIGIFNGGTWYLRNLNSSGATDITFTFGGSISKPVVGDWDDNGTETVGTWQ